MSRPENSNATFIKHPYLYYIRRYRQPFTMGLIALLFTNLLDVSTPLLLKLGIDQIVADASQKNLAITSLLFFAVLLGVAVFRYLWRIFFGRFHHAVADDLRQRIFLKFTDLSVSFFQKNPVGQLMSLVTNDVNTFRMGIGPGVLILFDALFLTAFILPAMIWLSWEWTWRTLIFLPLLPFFIRKIEILIHRRYKVQQDEFANVSGRAQEIITGIRVIKSYSQEGNQLKGFNRLSRRYEEACNKVAVVDSLFHPVMEFAVATGSVILLWLASPDVIQGAASLGTLVAFHRYIQQMIWPMTAIGVGITMLQQGNASFDRISELLESESDTPNKGTEKAETFESLEVRNLTFQYPGASEPTLKDISFKLKSGETLGIVGPVGAGKSTLAQILCHLYPIPKKSIWLNGTPLEDMEQTALRQLISYVPQDAFLFSETIEENIALGLDELPDSATLQSVMKRVDLQNELDTIPSGLKAPLGERGVNLSGGQKQRLTIARALIRKSPVTILDDALSAVDGRTERNIIETLRSLSLEGKRQGSALILISHRLATLNHADRILVLRDGQMEAIGRHEELMAQSSFYRDLYIFQSNQGENGVLESELVN